MAAPLEPDPTRRAQLRKLTEVSRALTYAVSIDQVLDLAVVRAAELLGAEKAVLMLSDRDGVLGVRAMTGVTPAEAARFQAPLDETLSERLQHLLEVPPGGFLAVPLVAGGEVTGIVAVSAPGDAAAPEDREWLLSALADQAAVALEKTRLDAAAEFRERVIGIVSHDLRTPIGAIVLGAGALLARPDLDERSTRIAARIQASAERAGRMIRDLLDYTQAHLAGAIAVHPRPADLYSIAVQAVEEAQATHPDRRVELRHEGSTQGEWDVDRVAQIVGNLLTNALAYSPSDSPVQVALRDAGGDVVLTVHNLGAPIPPARLPDIFQPMQRAAGGESRGVGLGLYIVRHLVEAHGGTVGVTSSARDGTSFTVRLPRMRRERSRG